MGMRATSAEHERRAPGGVEARARLWWRIDAYLTTQLLYVAARLGIPDLLAGGPRSADELASELGADAGALRRLLRGLVLEDIVAEDDGLFALTEEGTYLCDGVPGSLRGSVLARGNLYYDVAPGLLRTARDGGSAFEHTRGEPFFHYLASHPEDESTFHAAMAGRAEREAGDVVAAYDFGRFRFLVDVGGGPAILLEAILRSAPELRAVLLDRPGALDHARGRLQASGLSHRAECVAGDFFESVPAGADAYVLSRVLHDWSDDDAVRILRTCRAAMRPESTLLIVEAILPERAVDDPEVVRMDLLMLLLFGGARERTADEFGRLLRDAGLELAAVVRTVSPAGLSVVEAVPT